MQDVLDQATLLPLIAGRSGQHKLRCPVCFNERRKHKSDRSLSVKIEMEEVVYTCHHCGITGKMDIGIPPLPKLRVVATPPPRIEDSAPLSDKQYEWLAGRGISRATADQAGLLSAERYFSGGEKRLAIGFAYKEDGLTTAVKWRNSKKGFVCDGAPRTLWKIEDFDGGGLVIVEGEMDVLACMEAGVPAVSVPNGAPAPHSQPSKSQFNYLWEARAALKKASRVIIAVDGDEPGEGLAEELARRIGRPKCWRVRWVGGLKDANGVLAQTDGAAELRAMLDAATPWPVVGLRSVTEYRESVETMWRDGFEQTVGVGIPSLDKILRVSESGGLIIVTGVPGAGKSTFLTYFMYMLAREHDWNWAVFSAETPPQVMIAQLCALDCRKPFHGIGSLTEGELRSAMGFIEDRVVFLDDTDTTVEGILERTQAAVLRTGVRGLIIDPYQFLTHESGRDNESRSISRMLTSLRIFAAEHCVSVFLVAHPAKQYKDRDGNIPIPTGYAISSSAAFFNTANTGITVSREDQSGVTRITNWKSRFPWLGQMGNATLSFDIQTGMFREFIEDWSDFDL